MKKYIITLLTITALVGCSKEFLESDLQSIVTDEDIAKLATESPEALLNVAESFDQGTVNNLRTFDIGNTGGNHNDYGQKSIDIMMDIMSNDMIDAGNGWWYDDYYKYTARTQETSFNYVIWNYYYAIIKGTNQTIGLIGGIPEEDLTDDLKYVLARSYALRGFCYLQLIQIYQKGKPALSDLGVPIVDPSADLVNGPGFPRLTVGEVYEQIETDLLAGYNGLDGYSRADKTSIDKNIAAGFLARYYLLRENYTDAVTYAQQAQTAGSLNGSSLDDGFQTITNTEWIWGADMDDLTTSYYASFFSQMQSYSPVYALGGGNTPGYCGQLGHHRTADIRVYNAISDTDVRKKWFGPDNGYILAPSPEQIYNYKFYDDTFFEADYVYMRVAEMYLIEAEAKAAMTDDSGAATALYNLISTRDASYSLSTNTGTALMDEIRTHRRIELWGEGFGLLDMKRWGIGLTRDFDGTTHPNVPASFFNIPAGSNLFTFQIPEDEINSNDAISQEDQNP